MADDAPILTRVFLTMNPLVLGRIEAVDAVVVGDLIKFDKGETQFALTGEGRIWHRQRWAAQNYACQLRDARLRELRDEVDRLERLDFGLRR